jgi:hypothetical protein
MRLLSLQRCAPGLARSADLRFRLGYPEAVAYAALWLGSMRMQCKPTKPRADAEAVACVLLWFGTALLRRQCTLRYGSRVHSARDTRALQNIDACCKHKAQRPSCKRRVYAHRAGQGVRTGCLGQLQWSVAQLNCMPCTFICHTDTCTLQHSCAQVSSTTWCI